MPSVAHEESARRIGVNVNRTVILAYVATVLGGTSLLGERGTLVGAMLGQQVLNATGFLGLGSTAQYYFQGLLILIAAVVYTLARARRGKRAVLT